MLPGGLRGQADRRCTLSKAQLVDVVDQIRSWSEPLTARMEQMLKLPVPTALIAGIARFRSEKPARGWVDLESGPKVGGVANLDVFAELDVVDDELMGTMPIGDTLLTSLQLVQRERLAEDRILSDATDEPVDVIEQFPCMLPADREGHARSAAAPARRPVGELDGAGIHDGKAISCTAAAHRGGTSGEIWLLEHI